MPVAPNDPNNPLTPLKEFGIDGSTIKKTEKEYGEKLIPQINAIINSGYFAERNMRMALNRALAAGKQDMKIFMDLLDMNGKTNYANIKWKSIMIVNTIVARLVGRWMNDKEKVSVTAVDPVSIRQKKDEQDEAEFILENKDMLADLEQTSGVSLVSPDQFIPEDKDHLDLWAHEEQRLPEEILFEKGVNTVFSKNGWDDVLKRKILHDSAEVGLIGLEIYSDLRGEIQAKYCKPENTFYSYSEYPDFRDASIRGQVISQKLTEVRGTYPDLSEKEIFEISKSAKEWNASSNLINYQDAWGTSMFRPYDDWNVDLVEFQIRSLDTDASLIKKGRDGRMYVDKPKKKIEDVYEGNEYIENKKWNIYRGCYVKTSNKLLSWGLQKNMIRPQGEEESYEAGFNFCFYMYQNQGMRNVAIPEKIEEPVEQMILARLKIQQLVAKMAPAGYQYDIDGLQAIDLGKGLLTPLELKRVSNQTGDIYYRSRDAEGNRLENPITENPNAGSVPQLKMLIELYNYHLQVVRDETGINEYAEGQGVKPRISTDNVNTALETSFFATDYMQDACTSLMNEAAGKIAALLKDSVEFGSEQYREIMNEKDVKNRAFETKIEFLPTKDEILYVENMVNAAIMSNPEFVLYIDPFKIKRIARENTKLAELYLRQSQKRAIKGSMEKAAAQSKMNGDLQMQSAQAKAQGDAQLKDIEQQGKQSLATQQFVQEAMLLQMQPETITPPHVQSLIDIYVANLAKQEAEKQQAEMMAQQEQAQQNGEMPPEQMQMQPQMQEQGM